MQYFKDADEFLSLFDLDAKKPGCIDFGVLCELGAVMVHFPQYGVTIADLARVGMQQRGLSPLVYWSRMKRAIRPALESGPDALRALGVPVASGSSLTCPYLAGCLAEVIAKEYQAAEVADMAAEIAKDCGKAR